MRGDVSCSGQTGKISAGPAIGNRPFGMPVSARSPFASPTTSPYGEAAESALRKDGLWDAVMPRFVYAQDVSQAFQYVYTGAAAAGFCALSDAVSAVGREGCRFDVAEAPPVDHSACVLKRAKNREAARRFTKFLQSPEAEKIKRGIRVPVNGLAPALPVDETGPHLHGHPPGCRRPAGRPSRL